MAEILLEGRECETCGTQVRKGALFCYHCGESVAPDLAAATGIEPEGETESGSANEKELIEKETVIAEDEAPVVDSEKTDKEKPKLKTAADMRRKPKRIQKKRVEIVWEEPVNPPNVWFLIATVLFAVLAVGLWILAKYLG